MALVQQNTNGTVDRANAYIDVAAAKAYWADRGVILSPTYSDAQIEVAIVTATKYLDIRYNFKGYQLHRLQGTQWPRGGVTSFLRGIPPALEDATCALVTRVLSGKNLLPDPTVDISGQVVSEVTKKIGPIETTTKFSESNKVGPTATLPEFPEVSLMLRASRLIGSRNSGDLGRS